MPICPVCGSKTWIKRYTIGDWTIDECVVCGFAHIDPMPVREKRAECYSEAKVVERNIKRKNTLQKLSRFFKKIFSKITGRDKSAIFYKKLLKLLSPKAKILDIGCGDGSFICKAKEDFDCTGIEISGYLASLAQGKPGIKVMTGNFLDTKFDREAYDGVTMISLLEHLDDPLQAVKKCFEFLRQGGVLLMKTVNYDCLNRKIRKGEWTGFRPPDHLVYFNPSNLELLLKKAGFKKIKVSAMPFNDSMYCEAWK
ncbi:MAG: class I SAM-dependent methyltransferase [Candidatus Omnitrophica bacterium]|nr:class I SAM-dependent methyltransferase [Candidatus Omnitrophota bacterium]